MFMSMAALTIYVLIGRLIQSQRPQIGVIKAIGYSRGQVLWHYLGYALAIGMGGTAVGITGGLYLAGVFARQYAESLNIPFVQVDIHWPVLAVGALVAVAICTIGGLLPALATASMGPAQSLRPPLPGGGARHILERLLPAPGWLPMSARLGLRNVVRNPYRSLFLVMGAAFAVSLVLFGGGLSGLDGYTAGPPVQPYRGIRCQGEVCRGWRRQPRLRIGPLGWRGCLRAIPGGALPLQEWQPLTG